MALMSGHSLQLGQEGVKLGPVLVVLGELAVLAGDDMLRVE